MNLWIRSQDREKLLKVDGLQYQNCKLEENVSVETNAILGFYGSFENDILGEYKTKERALEILDEIQNILKPKYILDTSSIKPDGNLYEQEGAIFQNYNGNVEFKELSIFVYQMPEE